MAGLAVLSRIGLEGDIPPDEDGVDRPQRLGSLCEVTLKARPIRSVPVGRGIKALGRAEMDVRKMKYAHYIFLAVRNASGATLPITVPNT